MSAAVLVLNAGSSSIKFTLFAIKSRSTQPDRLCEGQIDHIGDKSKMHAVDGAGAVLVDQALPAGSGAMQSLQRLLAWIESAFADVELQAAAHRVVHGGARYSAPVIIDAEVLAEMRRLVPLAPLHQPQAIAAIEALLASHPALRQIACFDTAFHHTLPWVASTFALPRSLIDEGIRRYGFHGLSYEYIASVMPKLIGADLARGRVVVAHLGAGASMCALLDGRSIATTMGLTPLDGLPMGKRCGSLDPGVVLYLLQEKRRSAEEVCTMLYHDSGLLGVSGVSDDMRSLLESSASSASEAVELFVYKVSCELGALAAALGGLDAVIFTGGIGEHAAEIRSRVCTKARWLGIELDASANGAGHACISLPQSAVSAWMIPTDEDAMIMKHCKQVLERAVPS